MLSTSLAGPICSGRPALGSVAFNMKLVKLIVTVLTLPCEGAAAVASELLDGGTTQAERCAWRLHLLGCAGCRRFNRQLKFLRRAMARLRKRSSDEDVSIVLLLPSEARERISAALVESNISSPAEEDRVLDRRGSND